MTPRRSPSPPASAPTRPAAGCGATCSAASPCTTCCARRRRPARRGSAAAGSPCCAWTTPATCWAAGPTARTRCDAADGHVDTAALDALAALLATADAVLVADYGGPVTRHPQVRAALVRAAARVPVVWDPHPRGLAPPPGVRAATPNRAEAAAALRAAGLPAEATGPAVRRSPGRTAARAVGPGRGRRHRRPARRGDGRRRTAPGPRAPAAASADGVDTCGAGDRFAGRVALGLARGADLADAVARAVADTSAWVAAGGVAASVGRAGGCPGRTPARASHRHAGRHRRLLRRAPRRPPPAARAGRGPRRPARRAPQLRRRGAAAQGAAAPGADRGRPGPAAARRWPASTTSSSSTRTPRARRWSGCGPTCGSRAATTPAPCSRRPRR